MRSRRALAALILLGWAVACTDTPTGTGTPTGTVNGAPVAGLIVSDPGPAAASAAPTGPALASASALSNVVYISLAPGTEPAGATATLRNLGSGRTVITAVQDGGFDPVPLTAAVGDLVEVVVRDLGGTPVRTNRIEVVLRRPPSVVRTDPPPGKRDVALNANIGIVFSEPVNPSTLTASSVQLQQNGTPVAGTVGLLQGTATEAVFTPSAPLAPNTDYQLIVTTGVRDLQGDPLAAGVTVDFATESAVAGPVALVTVTPDPATILLWGTVQLTATLRDANRTVLSGRPITWSSDNSSVASAAPSGLITGAGEGSATITATAEGQRGSATVSVVTVGQLAFVSARDGNDEIYLMNTDGSGQVNLTNNPGSDYSPAWSPDGSRIAFISNFHGTYEIYVMNADGSGLENLTNNPGRDDAPVWSPDGTKIAFWSDRDGNDEIYVMNADGSGLVNLTQNSAADLMPAWSPDGSKIAFMSDRDGNPQIYEIYAMKADGSGQVNLTQTSASDDEGPAWSPDGSKIVFVSLRGGNWEIYAMNADGSSPRNVTNNPGTNNYVAVWSPDGTRIAVVGRRSDGIQDIYVTPADGPGLQNLTNDPGAELNPAWSPDGSRIAFSVISGGCSGRPGRGEGQRCVSSSVIYVMNADGSGVQNLTDGYEAAWRPR